MKFDREEVLSPFTAHKAVVGSYGYLADTVEAMECAVKADTLSRLDSVSEGSTFPFNSNSGVPFEYFLPAPYEVMQKKWVEEVGLKVGDKVRIVKKWEKGEGGFDCAMGFLQEVNLVGYVDSIEKDSIYVALHSGPYHTPYFALEKVEEAPTTYRHFADGEEFKHYREGWFNSKIYGGIAFKIIEYTNEKVFYREGYFTYKEFFNSCKFSRTGEPAGVKL